MIERAMRCGDFDGLAEFDTCCHTASMLFVFSYQRQIAYFLSSARTHTYRMFILTDERLLETRG